MKGETVEESGALGKFPREPGIQEVLPGLVPRLDAGDMGVDERAICHGAGDERRITVCRGGGGEASGIVRLRWRQRISRTALSSGAPDNDVFSRRKSSTFSACSSSSRAVPWRRLKELSRMSSATMLNGRYCEGFKTIGGSGRTKGEGRRGGGGEADVDQGMRDAWK